MSSMSAPQPDRPPYARSATVGALLWRAEQQGPITELRRRLMLHSSSQEEVLQRLLGISCRHRGANLWRRPVQQLQHLKVLGTQLTSS